MYLLHHTYNLYFQVCTRRRKKKRFIALKLESHKLIGILFAYKIIFVKKGEINIDYFTKSNIFQLKRLTKSKFLLYF